jgi:hypothetical protein
MTELTLRPLASADDARGTSGTMGLDGTLVQMNGSNILGLLRFPNATVPKNATINSAVLQGYFLNTSYDSVALTLAGIAADNRGAFTTTDTTPTWTTANVAVNISNVMTSGNGFYTIATVTGIVQEIVNRPGWASGNAIALGMHSLTSGEMRIYAWDYSDNTYGAKLIIDYTAAATGAAKKRRLRIGTRLGVRLGT